MAMPLGGTGTSNEPKFQFLGRWVFSSSLESRLKKFAISKTYNYQIKSVGTKDDISKETLEHGVTEDPQIIIDDGENPDIQPQNADNTLDMEFASQPLFLCTQDCTTFVANLREGPISSDGLCRLSDEDVISYVGGGSDDVIFNFSESVRSAPQHQHRFVPLLCEKVLLPKIKDPMFTTCSRTLLPTIKGTFDTFPAEACTYLLLPLLRETDLHCKLDPFLTDLENGSKQTILKSLLEGGIQILEEHHIPMLQNLLVTSVDKDMNEKLIDLLQASGNNLSRSSNFGKLLVSVTEQIGPSLDPEVKKKLSNAIQTHKSIQKARVMKTFQSLSS